MTIIKRNDKSEGYSTRKVDKKKVDLCGKLEGSRQSVEIEKERERNEDEF